MDNLAYSKPEIVVGEYRQQFVQAGLLAVSALPLHTSNLGLNMNQRDAAAIAAPLEAAIGQLSKALSEAEARLDERGYESFRRLIGVHVGKLSHELLDPIYAEHPSLMPEGLRD
ncbi:MAG: hypothetical protein EON54_14890 [Alcaligenaceae bacterium]|jgi:hypothetical protein|uniref:hypothetical protein n=1 Tax=unclassified Acidovorax TaxID=2684926 RepID=UPI000701596F|nr:MULTISPECIES: hypothetical protein [unclassified Acidovorax]KQO29193.1 hypothetical protein ASF19_15885 [Acidovorax sp. Leaf84]RYH51785.1 MAG: hypothetical protein EON54_14890 [Alcaligenaceae bacterium]